MYKKNKNKEIDSKFTLNFSENIKNLKTSNQLRVKRNDDDETLVEATIRGDYSHWLTENDLIEIVRVMFNTYANITGDKKFEILASIADLDNTLETFILKTKELIESRLTLIIQLTSLRWVTLVVSSKDKNYIAYYTDPKNVPLPHEYFQLLFDKFKIQTLSLSPGLQQQTEDYNCGLWALENAKQINQMLDENESIYWLSKQLQISQNKEYFNNKREYLSDNLRNNPGWCERHPKFTQFHQQLEPQSSSSFSHISPSTSFVENPKRLKLMTNDEKEKITTLLEIFVESFMCAFSKNLSKYYLLAKGERLTEESLKNELKIGLTGALLGVSISQTLIGSIPSLVASIRMISSQYYPPKDKAQKITKFFSKVKPGSLSELLSAAAVDIFYSYENQFIMVTDSAGDRIAMEKLAEDAVGRAFNFIAKYPETNSVLSDELITRGIIQGPSEKFFDPSVKSARIRISGYILQDKKGDQVNTVNLYEKVGLVVLKKQGEPNKYYSNKQHPQNHRYGYRRLLKWEQDASGELKDSLKEQFTKEQFPQEESIYQFISRGYDYLLNVESRSIETKRILAKIEHRHSTQNFNRQTETNKMPVLFDLRRSIKNFSGRLELLKTLHHNLLSDRTMAIVPSLSNLDISESMTSRSSSSASSGSAFSISGLGGIGKTQLALRYAELYARDYDFNVLWISAETQENLSHSFNKLANKLQLAITDSYGNKKDLEAIIDAVYEYFSDRKSLFIFDNVENYRAIENYLPKTMLGNKPTLLITSRYNNWKNVASVLSLDVFTENETEELIRKSLNLSDNSEKVKIKELNQLLQGLPLALQQALAYIKLRKNTDVNFSLDSYINLYKEKCEQLLNFDFASFSNDPYTHTVYTTWLITLEKINSNPLGQDALEALYIMAYLDPENITFSKFYYLNHINRNLRFYDLQSIMQLLISYSMISQGSESKFTIHRLLQQVIRLNLEQDKTKLEQVIRKTQRLIVHFGFRDDEENIFHYLHFLLYITEHNDIKSAYIYGHPEKLFFDGLTHQHLKYCAYFNDLAYQKFPKERYLKFIGNAIAYYIKLGLLHFLNETFAYLEKKLHEGILSKENIKFIIEFYNTLKDCKFKLKRLSSLPLKKELQRESIKLFYEFKLKIFGDWFVGYEACPAHSLKRSICSFETDPDKIKDIKNLKIKSHLKKVAWVTRTISSGLMAKDTLAALIQGDFSEVAINFGLIASSTLFGKISNKLLTQGKSLAADASLLEKDLGLESKTALRILFNKDVLSVGKRQFLGKTIQAASPYVARATSLFFVCNLKNEIQAYEMGDKAVIPDIISNGVIVGVDGLEAGIEGAELFEVITGAAEFTGPVGEVIALLAWLGSEIYTSEQQVEAINKYASLSIREEFVQFFRALIHLSPSEYLQLQAKNEQLVKRVILFLKAHPDINWYILPTYFKKNVLYNDSRVLLNEKRQLELDDSMPNQPNEGHLFCLSGTIFSDVNTPNSNCRCSYLCHHAIGIEYSVNRTGNATLVALGPGNQEVIAFFDSPTLFIVENGRKLYIGGDKINVFHLQGNSITGLLSGGAEPNILNLDKFFPEKSDYLLIDDNGFLCGKNSSVINYIPLLCNDDKNLIQLNNINQIQGRNNQQEIFYLNKSIRKIDGGGGRNNEYPDTFFLTDRSYKSPSFILRNNTIILFLLDSRVDSADYLIPLKEVGVAQVQFHSQQAIQHRFFFQTDIQNIQALNVKNSTITIFLNILGLEDTKTFTLTISNSSVASINKQTRNTQNLAKDISYLFPGTEMKLLNNAQVYLQEKISNNKTIAENINLFTELANRLEKTFSLQLFNNTMISIGQKKNEIFYINGLFESHLVGNGGENTYILLPCKDPTFPLAAIILYDNLKEDYNELTEFRDTLDLRELVKKYKQRYPDAIISPQVSRVAENLFLRLINTIDAPSHYLQDLECYHDLVTIQFKNAVLDNYTWYQNIDIFIDNSIPKNIGILANEETEIWNLQEAPLVFTEDKEIIVITNKDIEEKTEIIIQKNIGTFIFLHNEKDLILTNMLSASSDICTIIFVDYKATEMKKKILSATLRFFDQELQLQDNQVKIQHASFFDFENSENINDQITSSPNLSSTTEPSVNHQQSPQRILHRRPRRQVHTKDEETMAINIEKSVFKDEKKLINTSYFTQSKPKLSKAFDEDRILMIADDYSKKILDFSSKNAGSRAKKRLNQRNTKGQGSPLLSAQHTLKSSTKLRTENLAVNKNTLKSSLQTFFTQSKLKLSKTGDDDRILMIADDLSKKTPEFLSKNAGSRAKKRLTQRNSTGQASPISVQKKKSNFNLKNKHLTYTKINRNCLKQISKHSTQPILKSPVKSQTENLSVNKNNFFKNNFFQDKKISFAQNATNNFLNFKEPFKNAIRAQPRLGYQQSGSKSQHKPNQDSTQFLRINGSDVSRTLVLLQWGIDNWSRTFRKKSKFVDKKSRRIQKKADLQVLSKSNNQLAYRGK